MAPAGSEPEAKEPSAAGLQVSGRQRASRPTQNNAAEITNILLVEDNPADATLLHRALGKIPSVQTQVTHVTRLDQALDALAEAGFDLVFLDLALPDSLGLDTVRQISAVAPSLPIVVLSGLDDQALIVEALRVV